MMQSHKVNPIEVPEDVRAEAVVQTSATRLPPVDAVPDETRSELDREARVEEAEMEQRMTEGRPPAESGDA